MNENEITRREAAEKVGALGMAGILMAAPNMTSMPVFKQEKSIELNINVVADKMDCDDWGKLVDQEFLVTGQSFAPENKLGKVKIKLVGAQEHKHSSDKKRPKGIRQSGFSLVFEAPLNTQLESKTHTIVHKKIGECYFHLQRVHFGDDHVIAANNRKKSEHYEAIIN